MLNHTSIIAVRGVGFYFKLRKGLWSAERYWALKDISFELEEGESLGVIGGNGAGKSTLLRLIAGIAKPDLGSIAFRNGISATLLSLGAGMQPNLSGRTNAIMTGLLLGVPRRELDSRLDEIKEFSGLGAFFEEPVSTYSSGMTARLGFAAAHIIDPDVLLIDEVVGVGDESFKKKSAAVIHQRLKTHRTVVLVSHSAELVRQTCDRVLWIDHGQVRGLGAPDEVVDAYLATA